MSQGTRSRAKNYSSQNESQEEPPSRQSKATRGKKSVSGQHFQKHQDQSSSSEAMHIYNAQKIQETLGFADADDLNLDTTTHHNKNQEDLFQNKVSVQSQKEKYDKDNDEIKSKPSVNRIISSKNTPQQRKDPQFTDSKKKVNRSAQGQAVYREIRSPSSPFRSEHPIKTVNKSGSKSEIAKDAKYAEMISEQGSGLQVNKPSENIEISNFSPKVGQHTGHKGSAHHKEHLKGTSGHIEAQSKEIIQADQMLNHGDEDQEKEEGKNINRHRIDEVMIEEDEEELQRLTNEERGHKFNQGNQMIGEENYKVFDDEAQEEEGNILIEEVNENPKTKNSSYGSVQKILQKKNLDSRHSGAHNLNESIEHDQGTHDRHEEVQDSRQKYSIGEDLKIIEYVNSKLGSNLISKNFWKAAYEKDNLLNKRRSIDSLRDRYRNHLRYLSIDDCDRMKEWLDTHGEKGFANFVKKAIKNSAGNIIYVKRLQSIDADVGNNQYTNFNPNKDKKKVPHAEKTTKTDKNKGKNSKEKHRTNIHHQNDFEEDDIESVGDGQHYEDERPTQKKDIILRESIRVRQNPEPSASSKRKEYGSMFSIDNQMVPKKVVRDLPISRQEERLFNRQEERLFNTQEEENLRDKESWLREQAQKHDISPDQMMNLFYRCSMNSTILNRYFRGEHNLIWDKDEDSLITGSYKEHAKRALSRYKGASNVKQREEFLAKFEQLRLMRSGNLAQKQSMQLIQRKKNFL